MSCNGDCNQGRECNCECKMTKDEALRMAIEAMEYHTKQTRPITSTAIAIQACKEALAQPTAEQSSLVQEPMIIKQENGMVLKLGYDELPNGTAFYTASPSREWVGLSDDEINSAVKFLNVKIDYPIMFARLIEMHLKEKNG